MVRDLMNANLPGLVVCGAESGLRRASESTGANLIAIDGAAHFPWLEVPGSVRGSVAQFVRS